MYEIRMVKKYIATNWRNEILLPVVRYLRSRKSNRRFTMCNAIDMRPTTTSSSKRFYKANSQRRTYLGRVATTIDCPMYSPIGIVNADDAKPMDETS